MSGEERLRGEHVGGCNAACGAGGHFLHGDPPDIVTFGANSPVFRAGDQVYELAVAYMRATAERDALREQVARAAALAAEWIAGGTRWGGSNTDARAGCGYRIRAVLHPTDGAS